MDDDLNTAEALGAVFEFLRDANVALDAGTFAEGNRARALELMVLFDSVFEVLTPSEAAGAISADDVETLIAARTAASRLVIVSPML